jgi:hypothetical protein
MKRTGKKNVKKLLECTEIQMIFSSSNPRKFAYHNMVSQYENDTEQNEGSTSKMKHTKGLES